MGGPFFVSSLLLRKVNKLGTAQLTLTSEEKRRETKGEPKQNDVIHERYKQRGGEIFILKSNLQAQIHTSKRMHNDNGNYKHLGKEIRIMARQKAKNGKDKETRQTDREFLQYPDIQNISVVSLWVHPGHAVQATSCKDNTIAYSRKLKQEFPVQIGYDTTCRMDRNTLGSIVNHKTTERF